MAKNKPINPELLSDYHTLAMRADRRMLRLERLAASDEDYEGVLTFAYKGAQAAARRWGSKSEKARFDIKAPGTEREIKAKLRDIKTFLETDTSTKTNIDRIYKERAKTFNDFYKVPDIEKVSWRDLKHFYDSDKYKKLDEKYGYRTLARALVVHKRIQKVEKSDLSDEEKEKRKSEIMESIKTRKALIGAIRGLENTEKGEIEKYIEDIQSGESKKRAQKSRKKRKKKK